MTARAARLALLALLVAAPAWAQSKRYPAEPIDPDREAARRSHLWEDALDPGKRPYQELVDGAKQLAQRNDRDADADALDRLAKAIALLPNAPDAYAVRGAIELRQKQWAKCADDLAAADARSKVDDTPERAIQHLQQGTCEGRAGRLGDAERTLLRATNGSQAHGAAWLRLGEVRVALGKLEEAIGALDAALEAGDASAAYVHFLLGVAYDRARRPASADEHIRLAAQLDHTLSSIEIPQYPLLGADEHDYMMGLAYSYTSPNGGAPKPEYALMYFRRFVRLAPDSPWRRRADEHVRELAGLDYPQQFERRDSQMLATVDLDATRALVGKALPAMRGCLVKLPSTALDVTITRVGQLTPNTVRDRPIVRVQPAGVAVRDVLELDAPSRAEVDAAVRCVQPIAERVVLPMPKEHDTYYSVGFLVIAP